MCDVDGTDPYTMEARLCDDDGVVRQGAMHRGTDYPCTSHAHYAGEHILCTSPAHQPRQLAARLGDGLSVLPPRGYSIVGVAYPL